MNAIHEVWIWAEQRDGRLMDVSLEILGKASELAEEIGGGTAAILIGDELSPLARELIAYGADKVYLFSDPRLTYYQSDAYTRLISDLLEKQQPEILLLGGTTIGMDLAPSVAARIKTGLTAHSCKLEIDKSGDKPLLMAAVPGWGGGMIVNIACPEHRPQMVTVQQGVMEKPPRDDHHSGELIPMEVKLNERDFRVKCIEMVETIPEGPQIDTSDVVVVGGYGMKCQGSLLPLEELTDLLHGALGGTRPALDEGWIPECSMIGVNGKAIGPKLLITIGTSGANHYTAGFVKAGTVMAINSDPDAPIFDVCDIGIVGDALEVVPAMVKALKAL
ncbi:electron transfer flavoprotein subunit alpha/FixB family protein [Sediminispirochaeta smaragdinae]|uniref:Electron transfer flavoprotein alpha/beta-subunit n=1 Tax=Sediminispirochaeta smaragdinae (strain DSM 11293 / JCM 15392 / SEBR 4228) TaxID=573413 RepID=E1R0Z0_SEDSS|nr:electron transfer flavoprotein subunit alpha/FixB family protein [Sediminispirochaeta smaragdinae]ADK80239.1 Electron transfer flavoprotein alpha/beta-subunit [Sediminispirochaeta smaragdinae DSM 11293]